MNWINFSASPKARKIKRKIKSKKKRTLILYFSNVTSSETLITQIKMYSEVKESVMLKRKKIESALDLLKDAGVSEDARKKIKQESLSSVEDELKNSSYELKECFSTFIQN